MSRRFGRNQKRAMQKSIEQLKSSLQMQEGLARHMRERMSESDYTIRLVAEILGENFVGLPPEEISIEDSSQTVSVHARHGSDIRMMRDEDVMRGLQFSIHRLEKMQLSIQRDKMMGDIHFRYSTPSGDVGYTVSRSTWDSLPKSVRFEIAYHNIAKDMAHYLSRSGV